MLPDFPDIKEKFLRILTNRMKKIQSEQMGPLSEIRRIKVFEGRKIIMIRDDGSVDEIKLKKHIVDIKISSEEIESSKPEDIIMKFDKAAINLASQLSKTTYTRIEEAAEQVGNVIDFKGKLFSIDVYFEALEKIMIEFDENKNPLIPTIIPLEKNSEISSLIETNINYKKRFEEIIEIKKEEWRDREINRKLVG